MRAVGIIANPAFAQLLRLASLETAVYKSEDHPPPPAGSRWITIHPHGDPEAEGHPVLIAPSKEGDGWHVIGGMGGRKNMLRLRNIGTPEDWAKRAAERRAKKKVVGEQDAEVQRMKTDQKIRAKEAYVKKVAPHMGWEDKDLEFPHDVLKQKGYNPKAIEKLHKEHVNKLYSKAKAQEDDARQRLMKYVEAGENPLAPIPEVQQTGVDEVKQLIDEHANKIKQIDAELAELQARKDFDDGNTEPVEKLLEEVQGNADQAESASEMARQQATQLRQQAAEAQKTVQEHELRAQQEPDEATRVSREDQAKQARAEAAKIDQAAKQAEQQARALQDEAERQKAYADQQQEKLDAAKGGGDVAQVYEGLLKAQKQHHASMQEIMETKLGNIHAIEPDKPGTGLGYARQTTNEARKAIQERYFKEGKGGSSKEVGAFEKATRKEAERKNEDIPDPDVAAAVSTLYDTAADKYAEALQKQKEGDMTAATEAVLSAQVLLVRAAQLEDKGTAKGYERSEEAKKARAAIQQQIAEIRKTGLYKSPDLYTEVQGIENARAVVLAGQEYKKALSEINRIKTIDNEQREDKNQAHMSFEARMKDVSPERSAEVERAAYTDLKNRLDTMHVTSFLDRAEGNIDLANTLKTDVKDLPDVLKRHYQAGAYGALGTVSHITLGQGVLNKDVVDTLSTVGAAHVLAATLHERLSPEQLQDTMEALERYHADTHGAIARAAVDRFDETMKHIKELNPDAAETAGDLFTARMLKEKQQHLVNDALSSLGNAKGQLEMSAAIGHAMRTYKPGQAIHIQMPNTADNASIVRQLNALGLGPGEYRVKQGLYGPEVTLHDHHPLLEHNTIDPKVMETITQIRRGDMDVDNWAPKGFKQYRGAENDPLEPLRRACDAQSNTITDGSEAANVLRAHFFEQWAGLGKNPKTGDANRAWKHFVKENGTASNAYKALQTSLKKTFSAVQQKKAGEKPSVLMSGKFVKQQRAIRMFGLRKRMLMALGAGSGKTLTSLGAFSQLRQEGKVKRALFIAPTVNLGDFSTDMKDAMESPNTYKWYNQGDKGVDTSREARQGALKDASNDFAVLTHQSMRDDIVDLVAQHIGKKPEEVADMFTGNKMTRDARKHMVARAMKAHGIDYNMLVLDEGHLALNRQGKENSIMANVLDALSDSSEYYMPMTGTPHKNDLSEVHDWLSKLDSTRYPNRSRSEFMRKYGVDTTASSDALQRELGAYFYQDHITPTDQSGVPLEKHGADEWRSADLSPVQRTSYEAVMKDYAKASQAAKSGKWDEDSLGAMEHLYPNYTRAALQKNIKKLGKALGTAKELKLAQVVNDMPAKDNAKMTMINDIVKQHVGERGEPGIVFAGSAAAVKEAHAHLEQQGYRVASLTGEDGSADKIAKKDAFHPQSESKAQHRAFINAPVGAPGTKADILVMSNVGEAGSNLQRAKWVAQWDIPYTAKTQQQRDARAYRLMQSQGVHVYHLKTNSPLEEVRKNAVDNKTIQGNIFQSASDQLDDHPLIHYITETRNERLQGNPHKGAEFVP